MKWYTLTWEDSNMGTVVEHFPNKKAAELREREARKEDNYSQTYSITCHSIKTKKNLVNWLNAHYQYDNG